MNIIQRAILAALIAGAAACKKPSPPLNLMRARFSVGQVWTYKTRPAETGSRLIIGGFDNLDGKIVVHIKITGLAIKNPVSGTSQPTLGHAPISYEALTNSVVAKVGDDGDLNDFQEGYDAWLASFSSGKGGWFTIPVAEIPEVIEEALAKAAPRAAK